MKKYLTERQAWAKIIKTLLADAKEKRYSGVCQILYSLLEDSNISHETRTTMNNKVWEWEQPKWFNEFGSYVAPLNERGLKYRIKLCKKEIERL